MGRVGFVLHGHFYQPPRENPWTEVVSREPSAAPPGGGPRRGPEATGRFDHEPA